MLVCLNLQAGYSIFHNGWRPMYSFIIVSIRTKYENCTIVCIVEVITKSFLRKIKVPNTDLFGQLLIHVIVQLIQCRHQGTKRLNTTVDERVKTPDTCFRIKGLVHRKNVYLETFRREFYTPRTFLILVDRYRFGGIKILTLTIRQLYAGLRDRRQQFSEKW